MLKILCAVDPYEYYLIGEGKKTIHIVKKPPLNKLWKKDMLFYMKKNKKSFSKIPKEFQNKYSKHYGKIGMEAKCDKFYFLTKSGTIRMSIDTHPDIKHMLNAIYGSGLYTVDTYTVIDEQDFLKEFAPEVCTFFAKTDLTYIEKYLNGHPAWGFHLNNVNVYGNPWDSNMFIRSWCYIDSDLK